MSHKTLVEGRLHYALYLWVERIVKPRMEGEVYLIRYLDDFVACFQFRADAVRFRDVPTVAESGLEGYEVVLWHGLIAPKNLPRPILERVNGELNKILKNKDMQDRLAGDGVSAAGGTPEQFGAIIKRDIEVWRRVVQKAGVKLEYQA